MRRVAWTGALRRGAVVAALAAMAVAQATAAVSGAVVNGTSGKPQPGVALTLLKIDQQNGLLPLQEAQTDAQGRFQMNLNVEAASLLRATFNGVTYTTMLSPGQPSEGLEVQVYDVSAAPGAAKVSKHMVLFQPSAGKMTVLETFILNNAGKTAWRNPQGGTVRFYLPAGANGEAGVQATAPGGLPVSAPVVKTGQADAMGVDFPIKPGETRLDVSYQFPYQEGAPVEGKILTRDENSYLIAPSGVTLKGEGLADLGAEPQSQAHIWGLSGTAYKVELSGQAAVAAPEAPEGEGSPQIEEMKPRVFRLGYLILFLALGALAAGLALLYRKPQDAEGR